MRSAKEKYLLQLLRCSRHPAKEGVVCLSKLSYIQVSLSDVAHERIISQGVNGEQENRPGVRYVRAVLPERFQRFIEMVEHEGETKGRRKKKCCVASARRACVCRHQKTRTETSQTRKNRYVADKNLLLADCCSSCATL